MPIFWAAITPLNQLVEVIAYCKSGRTIDSGRLCYIKRLSRRSAAKQGADSQAGPRKILDYDFGRSFLGSKNGSAAVRPSTMPRGVATSSAMPGAASPAGTQT